jgi:enhancing lycopene biosynthesis protein 2
MNMLRVNIQASIDNEIIKTLMAMGAGEIDIPVDLIPFNINDKINY